MAVLKYTLLRLATFCILFAACLLLELGIIFALLIGLLGSWAVAYLFFNELRVEAGEALARKFGDDRLVGRSEKDDNEAEDALAEEYHREAAQTEESAAAPEEDEHDGEPWDEPRAEDKQPEAETASSPDADAR